MIYKGNQKLWKQVGEDWDRQFQSLRVEVHSKIHILNTAFINQG
jgi:hypothetical protein